MRILLMKKAVACIAVTASLVSYPILSSVAIKLPAQSVVKATQSVELVKRSENPTLARNTARKTESKPTESPEKVQKVQDKKSIGRCWKRLMDMVREVRHTQTNKKK